MKQKQFQTIHCCNIADKPAICRGVSMKDDRNLPELLRGGIVWEDRRKEIRQLLEQTMYGECDETVLTVTGEARECGSKCGRHFVYKVEVTGPGGNHSFPFHLWFPVKNQEKYPVVIYLMGSKDEEAVRYPGEKGMPTEQLLEEGIALAICPAGAIEKDDPVGFPQGLAKVVRGADLRTDPGALAAWACGIKLVINALGKREDINMDRIAAVGCSRFGKAALWAGAVDQRIEITASFDSGCGGAAINRGKQDEHITEMMRDFPHWLSPNLKRYEHREGDIPFDQHFLLALIAPRKLLVTSSTKDPYSDPYAEFLGLAYAQDAYYQYGRKGIDTWIWPPAGKLLIGDGAAYYLRNGDHGVEDGDWMALLSFMKS